MLFHLLLLLTMQLHFIKIMVEQNKARVAVLCESRVVFHPVYDCMVQILHRIMVLIKQKVALLKVIVVLCYYRNVACI